MMESSNRAGFEIVHQFPEGAIEVAWRRFLRRADLPSHYTAPEFFLEAHLEGKRPFAVLARDAGEVTGVLTGIHQDNEVISGLKGCPQICVDRGADAARTADGLARGLLTEAGRAELVTLFGWRWTPLGALEDLGFVKRETTGSVVLDLTLGPDALFKGFDQGRRRNIRKAINSGIEVSQASDPEDVLSYYEVIQRWRNTPRKKIQGGVTLDVFEKLASREENRRIFLAKFEDKIIAGVVVSFYRDGLIEYAANASLDEFLYLRPNDLIHWRVIEWACREGVRRYSLGSLGAFVRKFGGEIVPINRYRLDRTWLRRHDLQEKARELASDCLHKLPAPLQTIAQLCLGRR